MTETKLPLQAKVALISTRRAQPAADVLAGHVFGKYVLYDIMASVTAPLHELSSAHVVVLEVPPVVAAGFERDLLNLVNKILALNVVVLVLVQPSLRRKSNRTLWVSKWNFLPYVPFKFYQTCSCKLGNGAPGCHLTYFVGCSGQVRTTSCSSVPTLSSSTTSSVASLGVAIKYLCSLLFSGYSFTAIEHVELANETPVIAIAQCPPSDSSGGAQQAPNSATGAGKAHGLLGWKSVD